MNANNLFLVLSDYQKAAQMPQFTIEFVNLFLAGLLAGEEFVICYGVRTSLTTLEEKPQTQIRQVLIRKLRVLVPAIFLSSALSGIAAMVGAGPGISFGFRCTGLLFLLAWTLITFFGTVPINKAALAWQPEALPSDWRTLIARWERLDILRCWAAVVSFALLLTATALRQSGN
jgi:uncharacterized membrane protein